MIEALKKMLAEAVYAPSGDNSQPWRFEVNGPVLEIFNLPEQDATLYNFEQRGSYVAHGALIENLAIIAAQKGFSFEITYFPVPGSDCVARLVFSLSQANEQALYPYIRKRATNRKRYNKEALTQDDKEALRGTATSAARITLLEDPRTKQTLAHALTVNERLLLENRELHDFLFSHIRWTEAEEKQHKSGLYAKTLELIPPKFFMFKLCRNWNILQKLNKLGLSKLIAKDNAGVYADSPALGAVLITAPSPSAFIEAGRVVQRLWLTATSRGLAFQPVTALPYLAQRVAAGADEAFSGSQKELIKNADRVVRQVFGGTTQTIAMTFRVGRASAPSAFSSRLDPQITIR